MSWYHVFSDLLTDCNIKFFIFQCPCRDGNPHKLVDIDLWVAMFFGVQLTNIIRFYRNPCMQGENLLTELRFRCAISSFILCVSFGQTVGWAVRTWARATVRAGSTRSGTRAGSWPATGPSDGVSSSNTTCTSTATKR